MKPPREVLFLPAAAFAAGILFSSTYGSDIPVLLGGVVLLCGLWWLVRKRLSRHVACGAAFVLMGALASEYHRPGPPPELDAEPGETLLLSGCIVEPVVPGDGLLRFVAELAPGARVRISLAAEKLPSLAYGQMVEVQARVRKPRNFHNPGAFDYRGWLARREIFWLGSARGTETLRILPGDCGSALQRMAMSLRQFVVGRIHQIYPEGSYEATVLPALLVGEEGGGSKEWTDGFRRTGTYHALVVSGLHIAVVAGSLLFLLRLTGLPLGIVLLVPAGAAWTYAAVVNWQPPAVRSAAGFTLFLIARWFFRRGRVLNVLAAVLLVILALDPQALFDASLQLTVLSVAAIGGLAAPLSERGLLPFNRALGDLDNGRRDLFHPPVAAEFRIELRLLAETAALLSGTSVRHWAAFMSWTGTGILWIAESVLLSICIQLALAVPLALYFHTFSATAIGANVVVAPALSLAVPTGLLACLTGFPLFTAGTSILLDFARSSTAIFASLEPGIRIPDPSLWLSLSCVACAGVLGVAVLYGKKWWIVPAVASIATSGLIWVAPFAPDIRQGELEFTVIDVGQGDSLFVTAPDGSTLLVDAGGFPVFGGRAKSGLDPGEDVVSPYLWRRGLKRLDVVAVSHLHEDHAGGLPAIIRNFRPGELWASVTPASPAWSAVQSAAIEMGTRIRRLSAGSAPSLGGIKVSVLAPYSDYQPSKAPQNRDSLVLLLRYGRHSFLLTGDADAATEAGLDLEEVDVLKVAHHGSRASSSPMFLERSRPLFAAISAGADNSYGHPHTAVLERLRDSGTRTYRTDQDGLITFRTNGHRIAIDRPDEVKW